MTYGAHKISNYLEMFLPVSSTDRKKLAEKRTVIIGYSNPLNLGKLHTKYCQRQYEDRSSHYLL